MASVDALSGSGLGGMLGIGGGDELDDDDDDDDDDEPGV